MTSSTSTQQSRRDFVLGTAQLGAAYGWTNSSGELSEAAAFALMERAYELGVRTTDPAPGLRPSISPRRCGTTPAGSSG